MKQLICITISLFISVSCSKISTPKSSSDKPGKPSFNYPEGIYGHKISIKINSPQENTTIYYTTDNSDPNINSTKYISPIALTERNKEITIKSIAKSNNLISDISVSTYRIVNAGTEDTINWDKLYKNKIAISAFNDNSRNLYVVGYGNNIYRHNSMEDWVLMKFDNNGLENTKNWNKIFDGNYNSDYAMQAIADSKNNIYVIGTAHNICNTNSQNDWLIKKFNYNGTEDKSWEKKFDNNNNIDYVSAIAIDSKNNIYVVGSSMNLVSSNSNFDWWVKKFDSNGNEDKTNWNKKIDAINAKNNDYANSLAIDKNNNVYIIGSSENIYCEDSKYDWLIKKFNEKGQEDPNWNIVIDGKKGNDYANAITIDNENNIYVCGSGENLISENSKSDWWIKKYNSNGKEFQNWNKPHDGNNGDDYINSIAIDSNNNVYVAGTGYKLMNGISNYDWWVERYFSNGTLDIVYIDKKFDNKGGEDYINFITLDKDDNLYLVGFGENFTNEENNFDLWIKKFYN